MSSDPAPGRKAPRTFLPQGIAPIGIHLSRCSRATASRGLPSIVTLSAVAEALSEAKGEGSDSLGIEILRSAQDDRWRGHAPAKFSILPKPIIHRPWLTTGPYLSGQACLPSLRGVPSLAVRAES